MADPAAWAVIALAVIAATTAIILAILNRRAAGWRVGLFYERTPVQRPPVDDGERDPGGPVD